MKPLTLNSKFFEKLNDYTGNANNFFCLNAFYIQFKYTIKVLFKRGGFVINEVEKRIILSIEQTQGIFRLKLCQPELWMLTYDF